MDTETARAMWRAYEPYHAVTYFAPEARDAGQAAGLKGGWMTYFAFRAAPLGPVGPDVVAATFYNFNPTMVRRAIPDAWTYASPRAVLDARLDAADAALRRLLGDDGIASAAVRRAADLATEATADLDTAGRPLAAANAGLPMPAEPHLALWAATTRLREHRGDGHVAALLAAGLGPVEAHVTMTLAKGVPREAVQPFRNWSDDDWAAAEDRLRERGWLDAAGALTDAGRTVREDVERTTDALAIEPWQRLGQDRTEELRGLLVDLSARLRALVPVPNPMGLTPF